MDHRDAARAIGKWYKSFDPKKMIAVVDNPMEDGFREVACEYVVCPTCNGHGSHVNPSIDAHGLTSEDFDDDPDFCHDYRSGLYDVPCYGCNGLRVIPQPVEEADLRFMENFIREEYAYIRECEAERRMGA